MSSNLKLRALLDTNVFIYAHEIPKSNSSNIIDALNKNRFEAIITESTFKEVYKYFRKHYGKKLADQYRVYLFTACKTVFRRQLATHFNKYAHFINAKDLEQLVAAKELGLKYLVSYDKHFEESEEHKTPKQFAVILELKVYPTEY